MSDFSMSNPLNYSHVVRELDLQLCRNGFTKLLFNRFLTGKSLSQGEMRSLMYGAIFAPDFNSTDFVFFSIAFWYKIIDDADNQAEDSPFLKHYLETSKIIDFDEEPDYEAIIDVASDISDLIYETIYSTGDGKTIETAFCIVHNCQKKEMVQRLFGNDVQIRDNQELDDNISCVSLKSKVSGKEQNYKIYFNLINPVNN